MFTYTKMAGVEGVPLLMRVIASSVSVSFRAARLAREVLVKGDLGIVEKTGKNDLQTEADRSAQRCIVASLHKQFPKIPIFGEEELAPTTSIPDEFFDLGFDKDVLKAKCPPQYENIKDEEVVIWVDPLDGTKEFTQGFLDHVTVLIGIAVRGVATAGIINQPFHNYIEDPKYGKPRCIWGLLGLGSFGFIRNEKVEGRNIITTTRSHSDYTISQTVAALNPSEVMKVGGAGHKVLLLIERKADAYVFPSIGCKKWDTCAPEAILVALGGKLTDIHGVAIPYHANVVHKNTGGVLATVDNHDWYVNTMKQNVPDIVAKFESVKPAPPTIETTLSQQKFDFNPDDEQKPIQVSDKQESSRPSRKRKHDNGDSKL